MLPNVLQITFDVLELRRDLVDTRLIARELSFRLVHNLLLQLESGKDDAISNEEGDNEDRRQEVDQPHSKCEEAIEMYRVGKIPHALPDENNPHRADDGVRDRVAAQAETNAIFELIEITESRLPELLRFVHAEILPRARIRH